MPYQWLARTSRFIILSMTRRSTDLNDPRRYHRRPATFCLLEFFLLLPTVWLFRCPPLCLFVRLSVRTLICFVPLSVNPFGGQFYKPSTSLSIFAVVTVAMLTCEYYRHIYVNESTCLSIFKTDYKCKQVKTDVWLIVKTINNHLISWASLRLVSQVTRESSL